MKTRTKTFIGILAVIALAAGLSLLAGCAQKDDAESIRDVIEKFVEGVNEGDLLDVKECLDPDAEDSNTALTVVYFTNYFGAVPIAITSYAESGLAATVELTSENVPRDFVFTMVEGDDTYYITTIEDSTGEVIFE